MAAAVADFRPGEARDDKITKPAATGWRSSSSPPTDVLAALSAERAPGPDARRASPPSTARARSSAARGKLERKGLDAVVVNDISRPEIGFDAPDNEVTIVTAAGERHVPRGAKQAVAAAILDAVERLRTARATRVPLRAHHEHPGQRRRGRLRPLPQGQRAARGRRLRGRRDPARSAPARSSPTRARSARRSGRAYFRSARFEQAAEEFAAVVERHPVNDYAHFCLGRALENTGRNAEARRHAALAAHMRPDRTDYQAFSERLRAA